jgi:glycosyltransferase involved in cell wall biosynthesis
MQVAAVIPAYNEATRIRPVIENVIRQGIPAVVIDDGSGDETSEVATDAGATVIRHPGNRGKGEALKTAFRYAVERNLEAIVTLDGDGQHDPAEIPRLVAEAERKAADIVVGCRMDDVASMPLIRKGTNLLTSAILSRLAHARIRDSQSGFRLIRTRVLRAVNLVSQNYDLESEILVRAARKGFRIAEVPVRTIYAGSPSSIRPGIDAVRFVRLVLRLL